MRSCQGFPPWVSPKGLLWWGCGTPPKDLTSLGHGFPSSEMGRRWYTSPKPKDCVGLALGMPLQPPVPTYSPHHASGPATPSSPAHPCASGRSGHGPPGDSAGSGDTHSCQCSRGTGAPPGPGAGRSTSATQWGWVDIQGREAAEPTHQFTLLHHIAFFKAPMVPHFRDTSDCQNT